MRLISDGKSESRTSTLGSTTTSSYNIQDMNYASSLTNTLHSSNTSSVEPQWYLSQTPITNVESTNNTEMVSEFLFETPYPDPSKSVVRGRVVSIATLGH